MSLTESCSGSSEATIDITHEQQDQLLDDSEVTTEDSDGAKRSHNLGYRICGDNIDKTVCSRYMRLDRKTILFTIFTYLQYKVGFVFPEIKCISPACQIRQKLQQHFLHH